MRTDLTDLYRHWRAEASAVLERPGPGQVLDQPFHRSAWMTMTGPDGRCARYWS